MSDEKIQKAKDFIWHYLEDHNKELVLSLADLKEEKRHQLYVKKSHVFMECNKTEDNIITRERWVIGFEYM